MVLIVEVEDSKIKKPWLGGWSNRVTGIAYVNAASQTGPSMRMNSKNCCSQSVQIKHNKNASCQSTVDASTQMWRKDCFISCANDKYMTVKYYDENKSTFDLDKHARIIQKFYRSYKMLKNIKECTFAYRKIVEDCKKFEEERADLHRKRNQMEIIRQTYPQIRSDFEKLYSLIETWRQSRFNYIKKKNFLNTVKTENIFILKKTVEMLKDIESHRSIIAKNYQEKKSRKFLDFHCKALKWNGYKGTKIKMVSLKTQRAREYKKIYNDLNKNDMTLEKRLEVLKSIKKLFNYHNCISWNELVNLIDQENELLCRGINQIHLENLRKRITLGFLYFVRNSHDCCNTENSQEMELNEPNEKKKIVCHYCKKLLAFDKFSSHVRMKKLSSVTGCVWLHQQSIEKIDYDPYVYLLNGIRADESKKNCFSTLLYVIHEPEIYHLVKNIWRGKSIVSEIDDIFRLRLVRFNGNAEWAPWNCILLTEEESETHFFIEDLTTVYSKTLIHKIYLFHEIAKIHFRELIRFEKKFRGSSR
ncbi:IQ and ubiquitin-like domain-containing protein [Aphidius gifuensis]|uniref:IQ and ubiquitin-like domain-containing protein n=1 Tax=Aphidius gifuensis TaxID=684658 RepID=UPI001CDD382B|nr:IQ and ubiquitin-like domain-containing protein [Aphidius gifuensis]